MGGWVPAAWGPGVDGWCQERHSDLRIEFTQAMDSPMPVGTHDSVYPRCCARLRYNWPDSEQGQLLSEVGVRWGESRERKWVSFPFRLMALLCFYFFLLIYRVSIYRNLVLCFDPSHLNSQCRINADSSLAMYCGPGMLWNTSMCTDSSNPHTNPKRKISLYPAYQWEMKVRRP